MPPIEPTPAAERPFHVHLTGFGPFGPHSINPSWDAVKPLHDTLLSSAPPPLSASPSSSSGASPPSSSSLKARPIRLTSSLLPVSYPACTAFLPLLHRGGRAGAHRPDLVVHVGVGLQGGVRLEGRARRWGYEREDVNGELAEVEEGEGEGVRRGCTEVEGPEEVWTGVQREEVLRWVRGSGVKYVDLSEDAGLYLCEFTYYTSLASAASIAAASDPPAKSTPVLFVHVPPAGEPYSIDELTSILRLVAWSVVNEGGLH
ncbi:hypothetical protein JCM8097_002745 [Rhodosporidiobolus ruineniae]